MMPAKIVSRLDAALQRSGSDVILRRKTDPVTDLTVRASHRRFEGDEITGNILDGDAKVIMSPTGLDDTDWVYSGDQNTVRFTSTALVSEGTDIEVRYDAI